MFHMKATCNYFYVESMCPRITTSKPNSWRKSCILRLSSKGTVGERQRTLDLATFSKSFHLLSTYLPAYLQTMNYSFWRFYVQEPGEPEIPERGESHFPPGLPVSGRGRRAWVWRWSRAHPAHTPALFVHITRRVPISAYFGEGFVLGTSVHSHLARAQVHFTRNTKQLSDGPGFGWKPKEHNPPGHQGGGAPVPVLHLRMYPLSEL